MIGSQIIVEMLKQYEVEVLFGVPGDTSIPFYEALYDAQSDIHHILARDERSASFMADAYARLSHKPGICECPSGAGPLYSVPGVAEANASSIPLILITSDIPLSGEGKQTITELDCQNLFKPITKWSNVVKQVNKIPETIRRAFRIATTGRPGAVHLAFPQEVLIGEISKNDRQIYSEAECCTYPAYRTRGARIVLEKLVGYLMDAQKPVIIAGGGAKSSQAGQSIISLAEWLDAPVVTTISGQGIISDEHPLALGVIGDNGFHPHAHEAVKQGDTLLYIGCKMGSVSTISWTMPSYKPERNIIQIDINPEMLGNNYQNALSVAGDAKLILDDLLVLLKRKIVQHEASSWVKGLNKSRDRFWKDAEAFSLSDEVPLKPQHIIAELNSRLTSTTVVIADAGTPTPYISRFLKLGGNDSSFIIPRAYGGLGYTIPALVGAYFAQPQARLVGLFGDGSFGMSAGELETLSRLEIPAVLIHFNNSTFGWIKALQKLHSKGKYFSVDFTPGDPTLVAKGFGIKALHIETAADLKAGLDDAFASKGPVLLDIKSESEVEHLAPVYSWLNMAEGIEKEYVRMGIDPTNGSDKHNFRNRRN